MALRNQKFKPFYNSKTDDVLEDFYIPALSNCSHYKRVSAYFDSGILELYSTGIENIILSKGHISFIFSTEITENDFNLMKEGYANREKLENKLLNSLPTETDSIKLSNLAYLIAKGFVDIKIAFTKTGISHDKFGLMEDGGDSLYFRGSNNETVASLYNNFESFETTQSWKCDSNELSKIKNAHKQFDDMWNDKTAGIVVVPVPDVIRDRIISYSKGKLFVTTYNKENTFIFDCNEKRELIGKNNLNDPEHLMPKFMFYKQHLVSYLKREPSNPQETYLFYENLSYILIYKIIKLVSDYGEQRGFGVYVTPRLRKYLLDCDIEAAKRKSLGIAIKNKHYLVLDEFKQFCKIVNDITIRPLREPQLWGAFHIAKMIRSANFSVPGAGKTSIVYGAYAYLRQINQVNKIIMIGPLNSFTAWKDEFRLNFGNKIPLNYYDYHEKTYASAQDRYDGITYYSSSANLILINYESLNSNLEAIKNIIDEKTMLVFDEVHRVKSLDGKHAAAALNVCKKAKYRVVLTGTPIPNGYIDIYNFLNILFSDEYPLLFDYNQNYLKEATKSPDKSDNINASLYPFFCRTTKRDLNVPPPEDDDIEYGYTSFGEEYEKILKILYRECYSNKLLLYIRLIQASTNPSLIIKKLQSSDFHMFDESADEPGYFEKRFNDDINKEHYSNEEKQFISNFGMTEKFYKAINLSEKLSKNGEQSIIWCVFVDTIDKAKEELKSRGVSCEIIYGNTQLEEREIIIKRFINKEFDVLITNPHTLAESVSLHKNCHHAIYLEYTFNLVHMLQSRDRIHRLGLKEGQKTYYHYMMMDNPNYKYNAIDKKIYIRLKEKEQLQLEAVESDKLIYVEDNMEQDIKDLLPKR